jgi:type II secretory pathway pseudopilin PulG
MSTMTSQGDGVPAASFASRRPERARFDSRRGTSLLEVQIAFALLGVALAGLAPLVVMQLRQVRQLELRLQGEVVQTRTASGMCQMILPGQNYFVVPWRNPWARKLTGSGQILTSQTSPCDPGPLPLPTPAPTAFPVTIVELNAAPGSQNLTATVDVSAP